MYDLMSKVCTKYKSTKSVVKTPPFVKEVRRPVNRLVLKPWTCLRYMMSKYEPSELATPIMKRFDCMTYSKLDMYLPDTS